MLANVFVHKTVRLKELNINNQTNKLKMKNLKLNKTVKYFLCTLLALVCLTSCGFMEDERAYNKVAWDIKTKTIELEYLEKLYKVKSDIEYEQRIKTIDSLINNCID